MKGIDKKFTEEPNTSDSWAIPWSTNLAISPRYTPEIIFSKA